MKSSLSKLHIRAVIIDLDGLLINNDEIILDVIDQCLRQEFEIRMKKREFGALWAISRHALLEALISRFQLPLTEQEFWQQAVPYLNYEKIKLKKGGRKLLQYLKKNNIPAMLASSSHRAYSIRKIHHLNISHYFYDLITGGQFVHHKPAPDIFLLAVKLLGVPAKHCLVLDDSPSGIEGALKAGCVPWFVPNSFIQDPASLFNKQKVLVFSDLNQVISLLKKRLNN